MIRFPDAGLAVRLEEALAAVSPSLLDRLTEADRRHRHLAIGEIARHLAHRLGRFDAGTEDAAAPMGAQPSLFPQDLGPIGSISDQAARESCHGRDAISASSLPE